MTAFDSDGLLKNLKNSAANATASLLMPKILNRAKPKRVLEQGQQSEKIDMAQFKTKRQYEAYLLNREREKALCAAYQKILCDLYPGHPWVVEVKIQKGTDQRINGYAKINLREFMTPLQGFVFKLSDANGPNQTFQRLRDAGGEILERLKLKRGAIDLDASRTYLANNRFASRLKLPE